MTTPDFPTWRIGPEAPVLADGDVHVWRVDLDLPPATLDRLARLLDEDERARADRLRVVDARRRFVGARAALRDVLARYLGAAPEALRFAYGEKGKPALSAPATSALRFNVSHSHALALCAVTRAGEVGIDIEHVREVTVGRLAARFYAPAEQAMLAALPQAEAVPAFFRIWACKEAYLKATGMGVSRPLAEVAVTLGDGAAQAAVTDAADATGRTGSIGSIGGSIGRWTVRELRVDPGYAAALAVDGPGARITCWRWRPS